MHGKLCEWYRERQFSKRVDTFVKRWRKWAIFSSFSLLLCLTFSFILSCSPLFFPFCFVFIFFICVSFHFPVSAPFPSNHSCPFWCTLPYLIPSPIPIWNFPLPSFPHMNCSCLTRIVDGPDLYLFFIKCFILSYPVAQIFTHCDISMTPFVRGPPFSFPGAEVFRRSPSWAQQSSFSGSAWLRAARSSSSGSMAWEWSKWVEAVVARPVMSGRRVPVGFR